MPAARDVLMQQLHDEHAAALWRYCMILTGHDRSRSEDVVQETLLRAWKHPSVLEDHSGSVRSWLYTVARNVVIDEWRSRRTRSEFAVADVPESSHEVVDRTDQLLAAWVVEEAIHRLSSEHRAVLEECYYRGATVAEAASRLGIPEGTVKSRTHYALRALKMSLEEMGGMP